jgi:rare lipoprotein A
MYSWGFCCCIHCCPNENFVSRGTYLVFVRSGQMTLKLTLALALTWLVLAPVYAQTGRASFYSGGRTASGEATGPNGLTAAHRSLPFGTNVLVTNIRNGRTVVVRIVDRGPFTRGRIIDVSRAAARELDMISAGTAVVSIDPR